MENSRFENIDQVIERLKSLRGLSTAKEVAEMLGLSPGDFSNRKGRGTLLAEILHWAIGERADLNEIVYGMPVEKASPALTTDEERLLRAYRVAGRFQADLLEWVELKVRLAQIEERMGGLSPPDRKGAGGVSARRKVGTGR